jgi:hypothetical protein
MRTAMTISKLISAIVAAAALGGCATGCREYCVAGFGPGNSAFDGVAYFFDSNDPCQRVGKPEGYRTPGWCGGTNSYIVTNTQGGTTRMSVITVSPGRSLPSR